MNTHPQHSPLRGIRRLAYLATLAMLIIPSPLARAAEPTESPFVAHEWGTFTSVQGADGVLLDWNGAETSDLPQFVYRWTKPGLNRVSTSVLSKGLYSGQQRMETPVIYFYSKQARTVDVSVEFPKGFITEWYPQALDVGPSRPAPIAAANSGDGAAMVEPPISFSRVGVPTPPPLTNSVIRWTDLEVLPARDHRKIGTMLRTDNSPSHYFSARVTDADYVRVSLPDAMAVAPEVEKFLFYRGVGRFQTPLRVTAPSVSRPPRIEDLLRCSLVIPGQTSSLSDNANGIITVAHTGDTPLRHLFALHVQAGRAVFGYLDQLDPKVQLTMEIGLAQDSQPLEAVADELGRHMTQALVNEGLYVREAEAMVETWRDAWFEEEGARVLYVLPRGWTDEILPIQINPQPSELVRIMVGRAEVIMPETEAKVRESITAFSSGDEAERAQAVQEFRALRLGRFAAPAIRLALGKTSDAEVQKQAWAMLEKMRTP